MTYAVQRSESHVNWRPKSRVRDNPVCFVTGSWFHTKLRSFRQPQHLTRSIGELHVSTESKKMAAATTKHSSASCRTGCSMASLARHRSCSGSWLRSSALASFFHCATVQSSETNQKVKYDGIYRQGSLAESFVSLGRCYT